MSATKPLPGPAPEHVWWVADPSLMAGSWVLQSPCLVLRLRCPLALSVGGEAWPSGVRGPPARPAAARVPHPWLWQRVARPHAWPPSRPAARARSAIVASASRPGPLVSPRVGQSGAERLAGVGGPSPYARRPGRARHPVACVLPTGRTTSRPARGGGGVRWPPPLRGGIPDGTGAKERLKFLYAHEARRAEAAL